MAQSLGGPFDGRWSAVVEPQGGCKFTSILVIDVIGTSIVGNATNPLGVFPLTGTVDQNGRGIFRIGGFTGTIRFSGTTFEANYANDCGGRFAMGTKRSISAPRTSITSISVPLQSYGGIFVVPVRINNAITLKFMVDSGATDVNIPADVVTTLIRAGTLDKSDFIGPVKYMLANGSTINATRFRIRSLEVGGKLVQNVTGSVAPVKGKLLLGQSFLSQFKSWSIDNTRRALVLEQQGSPSDPVSPCATPSCKAGGASVGALER
jgi:clan AA aspartic protease (TIGR02281 family)